MLGPGGEYTRTTQFPVFQMSHADGAVAIVGGPTYNGSDYPAPYPGTIFFGDYGSGILRRYDPAGGTATQFATGAEGWVDLESAPAGLSYARRGDLIYASIGFSPGDGEIGRISYTTGNRPPVAAATASPGDGQPPLPVQFDGTGSSDPDGDPLAYLWDFGDGTHGTGPNPAHTYTVRGRYTARLTVGDGSLQASKTLIVNVGGPTVTISAPVNGSLYQDGVPVPLQGSATEAGQPASSLSFSWHVILHHATHLHDLGTFTGASASFTPLTDHDADSSYTITLTVTDSDGIAGTKTVDVQPQTVALTLDSTPAGAPLGYAGTSQTAPFTTQAAVGFHAPLSAASQFTAGGLTYTLSSWSDGGAAVHEVTVPAHDLHLTATYTGSPALGPTPLPAPVPLKASSPVDTVGPSITFFPSRRMARLGRLSGYARDAGGGVQVAVRAWHSGKGPCRWWSWRVRRLRRGSCAATAWIRAQRKPASTAWTVWLGGPLPPGRYVLFVRAFDRNGNVTYGAGGRTRLSLRV
jgi:PKD repeat protein